MTSVATGAILLLGPGLTIHVKEMVKVVVLTIPLNYKNNRLSSGCAFTAIHWQLTQKNYILINPAYTLQCLI